MQREEAAGISSSEMRKEHGRERASSKPGKGVYVCVCVGGCVVCVCKEHGRERAQL